MAVFTVEFCVPLRLSVYSISWMSSSGGWLSCPAADFKRAAESKLARPPLVAAPSQPAPGIWLLTPGLAPAP
jgi:hypothetical protein